LSIGSVLGTFGRTSKRSSMEQYMRRTCSQLLRVIQWLDSTSIMMPSRCNHHRQSNSSMTTTLCCGVERNSQNCPRWTISTITCQNPSIIG
ncbi:Os12g0621300, partial [Oryza sativa Japonica Group]